MTAFGIDFGTTNSVLATAGADAWTETIALDTPPQEWAIHGFDKVLPTVLAEVGGAIDFGWRAKRQDNQLAAVKRLFRSEDTVTVGSKTMPVEEAAALFFRQIQRMGSSAGLTVDHAVVTIPANSRGVARHRTKVSAGLAGIEVMALLNEPTAAAMAYGRLIHDGERVLVFDWGGGTLDVTVLQSIGGVFLEEASKGIQALGGIDLDQAFAASVRRRLPPGSRLDAFDLELAKIRLSEETEVVLPLIGGGTVTVTRGELEEAIRPLVVKTQEPIERCRADLGAPKIDHLVMVGGSSKIPMVQRYVREMLRLDPMQGVDPMTAVAEGAAIAAGILSGDIQEYDFFVATEHALGTIVNNDDGKDRFSVLIPRNTKLPAAATDQYNPKYDYQEQVRVVVIEGDPDLAIDHEDNVILKDWEIPLEGKSSAEAAFTITFEYDVDGILHVRVVDLSGRTMMEEELAFGASSSKQELADIRRRVDATEVAAASGAVPATAPQPEPETAHPPAPALSEESRASIRRAKEKVYPFVDDATQSTLDEQIQSLFDASPDEEEAARETLERSIRQHAYLL